VAPACDDRRAPRRPLGCVAALAGLVLLTACGKAEQEWTADIRPVRVVTVEKSSGGRTMQLTGTSQAQTEVNLAFRIDGRVIGRLVNVGDQVKPGQVIARLDPENEENALRAARASLAAAMGQHTEAQADYARQARLIGNDFTPRARYDAAVQALQTTRSAADAAQAQVNIAENRLSYTVLYADGEGTVTAVGAEAGEVVQAGRMIVQLARADGRDGVFDVPPAVKDAAPADVTVEVFLTADPGVKAIGRVREVAPRADPVTGTFRVRVGLIDPPPTMRLGSTVTGRIEVGMAPGYELPATAITRAEGVPAVWVVDPQTETVSLRTVEILRFDPTRVVVAEGLGEGDIVVTAGVQALRPGQQVRLLGNQS
jgi:RND family efflux transporter MFP subunit